MLCCRSKMMPKGQICVRQTAYKQAGHLRSLCEKIKIFRHFIDCLIDGTGNPGCFVIPDILGCGIVFPDLRHEPCIFPERPARGERSFVMPVVNVELYQQNNGLEEYPMGHAVRRNSIPGMTPWFPAGR